MKFGTPELKFLYPGTKFYKYKFYGYQPFSSFPPFAGGFFSFFATAPPPSSYPKVNRPSFDAVPTVNFNVCNKD